MVRPTPEASDWKLIIGVCKTFWVVENHSVFTDPRNASPKQVQQAPKQARQAPRMFKWSCYTQEKLLSKYVIFSTCYRRTRTCRMVRYTSFLISLAHTHLHQLTTKPQRLRSTRSLECAFFFSFCETLFFLRPQVGTAANCSRLPLVSFLSLFSLLFFSFRKARVIYFLSYLFLSFVDRSPARI